MILLDTSLLIEFLSGDEERVSKIESIFRDLEKRKRKLFLPQEVVVELVYYLGYTTGWDREDICDVVSTIVMDRLFSVENRDVVLEALELFKAHEVSFLDALKLAKAKKKGITQVLSDKEKFEEFGVHLIKM